MAKLTKDAIRKTVTYRYWNPASSQAVSKTKSALTKSKAFTVKEIAKRTGFSTQTVRRAVMELDLSSQIKQASGKGRAARYLLK